MPKPCGLDLVSVPVVAAQGPQITLNAAASELLRGAALVTEAGVSVPIEDIAHEGLETVIVRSSDEGERSFLCHRSSAGGRTVTTLIEQTELRAERKKREDAETLLDWTCQLSGAGGWEVDLVTNKPQWSEQVKRIHEVPMDYQPDMESAINFYAPQARPAINAAVQKAMIDGTDWDLELPFVTAKGRKIWVRAIGRAEFENGECRRLRGTFQDITDRREILQRYQAEWERARDFERVFRAAPTCQCIAGTDGYLLTINKRWTEVLGYSEEELTTRPFIDFVHPDDLEKTRAAAARMGSEDMSLVSFENRYRRKDGSYRWLRWYAISDLEAKRIYAVAADVSDEKERSLELQRLASVADRTENGVIVTDPASRVVWANPAFVRATGYQLDEIVGRSPEQLLPGEDTDVGVLNEIRAAIKARRGAQAELILYRKDGSPFWSQLDIQPVFDDNGVLINFVAIESDVTERKNYEAELRGARDAAEQAATAAAEANRAKGLFLANVSHEIRTPLNGVLGVADLLSDTALDNKQRHFVETISQSGQALLTLLNDVLDFSKIEANKLELATGPYDFSEVVRWVTEMMRVSADKKGLRLVLEAPDSIPPLVGDEGRIRQIILNLVSNAIKFTQEGEVKIVATADITPHAVLLKVQVSDTGVGMTSETLSKLFRPFTQADASTTRQFGGTGLGLSICKSLVEMMGGQICVQSKPGHGSSFSFQIEQAIAQRQAHHQAVAQPAADLTGCRVLLVEDNPTNQLVAEGMLRRLGCDVELAGDGVAAVAMAAENLYDIVLMDCQMPHMDGYEATRAIRRLEHPIREVPIIALTASTMKGDRDRCHEAGMTDYLSKPVQRRALATTLGTHWTSTKAGPENQRPRP